MQLTKIKNDRYRIQKYRINPLSANPTKWSNTLKTIHWLLPTNCLSVFDNCGGLVLKGLTVEISL